jgi:hypothetical protein
MLTHIFSESQITRQTKKSTLLFEEARVIQLYQALGAAMVTS